MKASHFVKIIGAAVMGLICIFVMSCSVGAIEKGKGKHMDTANLIEQKGMVPVVESITALDDTLFFSQSDEPLVDMVYNSLGDKEYEGIALKVPLKITLPEAQKVPLLFVSRESAERSLATNMADNCFIVAYHWQNGIIASASCFTDPVEKIPMPESPEDESLTPENEKDGSPMPPLDEPEEAVAQTSVEVWNIKKVLGGDLGVGKVTFAVFSYNWAANPVTTEIIDTTKKIEKIPAIDIQSVIEALDYFHTEGEPAKTLPDCRRSDSSPVLKENGIQVLMGQEDIEEDTPQAIPLHMALQTGLDEAWMVETLSKEAMGDLTKEDETVFTSWPQALVPASIVIARKNIPTPLKIINLMVPLYTPPGDGNETLLNGFVSLDLKEKLEETIPEGRYYVYALVGAYVSAPVHFTVFKN